MHCAYQADEQTGLSPFFCPEKRCVLLQHLGLMDLQSRELASMIVGY